MHTRNVRCHPALSLCSVLLPDLSVVQNQALQQRMVQLKDDPEMADMFADIQKGGKLLMP